MRVLLRRLDAGPDRVIEQPEAATEPAQITGPNQRRRQTTAHLCVDLGRQYAGRGRGLPEETGFAITSMTPSPRVSPIDAAPV